ncbi:MAG: VOC family protein [Candidatus Pacebacteria bacterium]|nr:VOC family protein [Candidatus Paceibacterota bacterium]MBP9851377.1 VOC family protein [Candidatus Paceibacterota bacterium]
MAGIKHIEFWVSNLKKSLSFYEELFELIGWERYHENGFHYSTTKIYFLEKKVLFNENIGPRHICFEADSKEVLEKVSKFLIDQNADIIRGPIEYTYKGNSALTIDFKDPDGYVIEVATRSINN